MNMINKEPERHEIESLLPWHAAGTLSRRDADRVEQALAGDVELARRYNLVREELAETILLNESLGAPSARAMERLFAEIDSVEAGTGGRRRAPRILAWSAAQLSRLTPRTLAWSAGAAVLAIVLQAGLIAGLYVQDRNTAKWHTAFAPSSVETGAGVYALIAFVPQASAEDITRFLDTHKAAVVDGPRGRDMYKVRVGPVGL